MKRSASSVLAFALLEAAALAAAASGADAEWRYLDAAEPPPADWRECGFSDAAWRSGPPPLGYGDAGLATELRWGSDPAHKPVTAWFRRAFDAPALRGWLAFAGSAELKALPPLDRARRLAGLVDDACTPPGGLRWLERTCAQLEQEFADKPVLLGAWLNQSHAGVCRHRALLFKLLADEAGLKSALVRGNLAPGGPHIWNELSLEDGRCVLVDTMLLRARQTFADVASPDVVQRYRRVDNAPWYEVPAPQSVP